MSIQVSEKFPREDEIMKMCEDIEELKEGIEDISIVMDCRTARDRKILDKFRAVLVKEEYSVRSFELSGLVIRVASDVFTA